MRRRLLIAAVPAGVLAFPAVASAHGIVGKTDLPIPRWLFAWAAAVVLIVSFAALATLWPKPRLEQIRGRDVGATPARVAEILLGALGIAIYGVVVYAALEGTPLATANIAPTFVYVVFWVGLAFMSLLVGDLFRALNPWRAFARACAWAAGRVTPGRLPAPMPYPSRLGRWPAVAGIVAFAWLELVYVDKTDPTRLGVLALAYGAVQLVGMSLWGIETWSERGDAFGVYFSLFARLSPLRWESGRLRLRPPAVGAIGLEVLPGTIALLVVMIGSTSFDGFSVGSVWVSLEPHVQDLFTGIGLSIQDAGEAANTLGLAGMIGVAASVYLLGVLGMKTVESGHTEGELAGRFVHTLLPIALAYVVAHYFSLLTYQGQAMAYLVSDPLGRGSDLFGTASSQIDYGAIGSNAIWYVQVAALVSGHVAALTLAHDRALVVYQRASRAMRSQYWMLAVMVGFTSLGLWILSSTQ